MTLCERLTFSTQFIHVDHFVCIMYENNIPVIPTFDIIITYEVEFNG